MPLNPPMVISDTMAFNSSHLKIEITMLAIIGKT